MRLQTRRVAIAVVLLIAVGAGYGQGTPPNSELPLLHGTEPLPSYEVATIKPIDPETASGMVRLPPGITLSPLSIRRYIMNAYGAVNVQQVAGGPEWLNKDSYQINVKVPEEQTAAMQTMTRAARFQQNSLMQQRLLAERFHLKAHFETRVLPVYELVPAKGGIKISAVAAPPELKPGESVAVRPGAALPPGTSMGQMKSNGVHVVNGHAITMKALTRIFGDDLGERPVVDRTGFTGYFDLTDFTWAGADASAAGAPEAASLFGALEEQLGLRLVPRKAPIEVLVIDSIERPSAN